MIVSVKKRTEFLSIQRDGRKFHTKHFLFIVAPNDYKTPRLGMVITKKIANAVGRNRIKRLIREGFRQLDFKSGYDYVIIAKRGVETIGLNEIKEEFSFFIRKAGLFNNVSSNEREVSVI